MDELPDMPQAAASQATVAPQGDLPDMPSQTDGVAAFIDSVGDKIAVPGHPDWNATNAGNYAQAWTDNMTHVLGQLYTNPNQVNLGAAANALTFNPSSQTLSSLVTGQTPYQQQQQQTQQREQQFPITTAAGNLVGTGVMAYAGGEVGAGVGGGLLPNAGIVSQVTRGAITGAGAGAASTPEDPLAGAETGAEIGGAVSSIAATGGKLIRAISRNTPSQMQDIAETSDVLTGKGGGIKAAGSAEVMGLPNMTGERTIANMSGNTPPWLKYVPFGQTAKNFTGWLSGAAKSQGEKAMGVETAAAEATVGTPWMETLEKEPALQSAQAKIDMHNPAKFAEYYPQLTPEGKTAAITGMVNNAYGAAVESGNGLLDVKAFSNSLKDIMKTTGDVSMFKGEQKWTLQGLQKLAEMSDNPKMTRDQLLAAAQKVGQSKRLLSGIALGLIDDVAGVASHGAGVAVKVPVLYNITNRILDSKTVRNGLIDLAQSKTPTQTVNALVAIHSGVQENQQADLPDMP